MSLSDWPSVSAVIPCRNMGPFVGDAIRSALRQTRPPNEILVVDDGSTDNSREVIEGFGTNVKLLQSSGRGSAVSRNIAILAAAGEYIAFLDADDLWYPEHLERQIGRMRAEGRGFSFSDFQRSADPAVPGPSMHITAYTAVAEGQAFGMLLRENFVLTSSAIVRKDVLAETGLFKPKLKGGQDFELWLRIARQTEFTRLRDCLAFYRQHGGNITTSSSYAYFQVLKWEEVQREHHDVAHEDRRYIRHRLGLAAYDAGRHSIRQRQLALARRYLAKAVTHRYRLPASLTWLLLSCAPGVLVGGLLEAKQRLHRRGVAELTPVKDSSSEI